MKNARINTDLRLELSLNAGGALIDMTSIDVLSLYMYCNPQKARDGAIKHSVSTSDAKVLEMIWPADVQRYLGSHSVHGTIRYAGAVASFDIPAVNVVSLTSEADISTDTIVLEAPVGTEDLTATITIQGIGPQGPQGPKGDKMTYADLTQEDKKDLYEGGSEVMKPLLATKQNTLTDTDGSYGQRVAELEKGKANIQHQHTVADITNFPELYYDATAFFTSGAYPSDKYEELLDAVKAKRTVYATVDEAGHISYVFFMSSANSDGSSSRVLLTTIFADGGYLYLNTFVLQQSGMTPLQESITGKANKATTLAGYGIGDAYTKSEVDTALEGKQDTLIAGNGIIIEQNVISATGGSGGGGSVDLSAYAKTEDVNAGLATKQDKISDLATIREGAAKGATALQSYTETDPVYSADKPSLALKSEIPDISGKQDKISDLDTIRSGAAKGATALQSYTETDPIYTADKPSIAFKRDIPDISGKADKTAIVTETAGNSSYRIAPNRLTRLGTLASNVTLSLNTASEEAGVVNVYDIIFSTPATNAPSITWPEGITWVGGSAPAIAGGKTYEVSIMDNLATYGEF